MLAEADDQITAVRNIYEATLREKSVSPTLQTKIKGALENYRSSLDYIAHAITERDGKQGAKTYYPLAPTIAKFPTYFEQNMPGVAAARPDIMQAIERHQPLNRQWLGHLGILTNENKHRQLTPQTRDETRFVDTRLHPGQGGIAFQPYQPGKGGVSFGGQVFINAVEVEPVTLQPIHGGPKPYTETIYVDWLFIDLGLSALGTLEEIQGGVGAAVNDVCHVAGL